MAYDKAIDIFWPDKLIWIFEKSGNTDLSDVFDTSKADVQGDPNELLMEAFEKIAGKLT